jgi:hypothetical protein
MVSSSASASSRSTSYVLQNALTLRESETTNPKSDTTEASAGMDGTA